MYAANCGSKSPLPPRYFVPVCAFAGSPESEVRISNFCSPLLATPDLEESNFQLDFSAVSSKPVEGRLLVKFIDGTSEDSQRGILSAQGAKVEDTIPQLGVKILKVPPQALQGIQNALSKSDIVEYVEVDSIIEPTVIPDDTEFSKQWHLSKIQAPSAWDVSKGSSNVIIAILDTGFDSSHPDLAGKFVGGYNAYNNNNDWSSAPCGHGNLVAGVAASATNNGIGVAGLGWQNMILPIKVTGSDCYTTTSILARAIAYATDSGARVANISFAIYAGDRTITNAAKYMYNHGGLVVAAAGNSGQLINGKDNRYIISVGATDNNDNIASFSTYGKYVDFSAPGVSVYTTCICQSSVSDSTGTYTVPTYYMPASGTSFSSPIVSGLVALMYSKNPSLSPQQVYDVLKQSSVDLGGSGDDNYYGWGRIDASKALQLVNKSSR